MQVRNLIARDLAHIWHPCSQMKDYEQFLPLVITGASGPYIEIAGGQKLIDANSSWWSKALGHKHPRLHAALLRQYDFYEHVISANTCQIPLVELSERLVNLTQTLQKVFYASDGSSAIEIAIKMSLHARQINNEPNRNRFIALENAYHGETLMALSVSDVGLYKKPYQSILTASEFLSPLPYLNSKADPLFYDCGDYWPSVEAKLQQQADTLSGILFEPLLQAAGGMRLYSMDFIRRLQAFAKSHNIHLIADEIMTGLGRCGYPLACQYAGIEPDFLCLGKALTGGVLPMSAVLTSHAIYDNFYDDYETQKAFLHSHTFSGNALAAAVALECLTVLEEENIYQKAQANEDLFLQLMQEVAAKTGRLKNIRHIGAMVAADLIIEPEREKERSRWGYAVYQEAVRLGALLRPLGNTIYWTPPLNTETRVLHELKDITIQAIRNVFVD